jgi:hypothetical protein
MMITLRSAALAIAAILVFSLPFPASAAPSPAPSAPAASAAPASPGPEDPAQTARMRAEFLAWQGEKIDRTHYTAATNAALTDAIVAQVAPHLSDAGALSAFTYAKAEAYNGGFVYTYTATCAKGNIAMMVSFDTDGKISVIHFAPAP